MLESKVSLPIQVPKHLATHFSLAKSSFNCYIQVEDLPLELQNQLLPCLLFVHMEVSRCLFCACPDVLDS